MSNVRYEIRSVSIWSLVRIAFFLNLIAGGLVGLFCAMALAFFLGPYLSLPLPSTDGMDIAEFTISSLLVILPLTGAFAGAVFLTLFEALLVAVYNLLARMFGGLEMSLDGKSTLGSSRVSSSPPSRRSQPLPPPPPPQASPEPPEPKPTVTEPKATSTLGSPPPPPPRPTTDRPEDMEPPQ